MGTELSKFQDFLDEKVIFGKLYSITAFQLELNAFLERTHSE